ncbi:MAG: 3-hydroxybutyryl-CoA dehydrogenase [Gammaproteobacteria bacterium]
MGRFRHIVALGAGRMGRGIAHVFAYAGYGVTLLDVKDRDAAAFTALQADAIAEIESNLHFLVSQGIINAGQVKKILALISVQDRAQAQPVLAAADIVLEAVPETKAAKQAALQLLGEHCRPDTVVTSTTSTMAVTELQSYISHPERFINTHFLNPAYLIPLVEISANEISDARLVDDVVDLFQQIGKVPVRCSDKPGYIVPRLQALIMSEACRMVEQGVATAEDIDKAILYGFGPRYATMGVMEFIDWGGVDILYYAGHYMAEALNSPAHAPPESVSKMMQAGHKGMREGQGYYDFSNIDVAAWQQQKLSRFVTLLKQLDQIPRAGV